MISKRTINSTRVTEFDVPSIGTMTTGPIFNLKAIAFSRDEKELEAVGDVLRNEGYSVTVSPLPVGVYELEGYKNAQPAEQ